MKERPIIMSAPMVRAILSGLKTQTRRVIKPQPERCEMTGFVTTDKRGTRWATGIGFDEAGTRRNFAYRCPYGRPGDRLWLRETHAIFSTHGQHREDGQRWGPWGGLPTTVSRDGTQIVYYREGFDRCDPGRWRSPIHMPRWASRITLEITSVRVERLQDITEDDAKAEGCEPQVINEFVECGTRKTKFAQLWESINGPGSWSENPWVWVVEFARVDAQQAAA